MTANTNLKEFEITDREGSRSDGARDSMEDRNTTIIVFGNEKGGSGKSTSAMHTAIALLRLGYKVGTIDLDARQGTMTNYMKNRFEYVRSNMLEMPSPTHMSILRSDAETVEDQQKEEKEYFQVALEELCENCDYVVIDTPGTDSHLSRLAHFYADILITPVNDSFIDLDLIAKVDPNTHEVLAPSVYTKMVNEQRTRRASGEAEGKIKNKKVGKTIDWLVMRSRISHVNAKNKDAIEELLEKLSKEYDFRLTRGFGERVVFKELFLKGITLLDMKAESSSSMTISQLSARQEIRNLINAIAPDKIKYRP
jgi:chromosome partitioning protein